MVAGCDVVIVSFNSGRFLLDAVRSAGQSAGVARVFVIDNASSDGSLELLPGASENLVLIRNPENLGFAAGCNIGIARASSEYVLLLNPDCRLEDRAIEQLIDAFQMSERVGMTGPLLLNPDGSEQAGARRAAPTTFLSSIAAFRLEPIRRRFSRASGFLLRDQALPKSPTPVDAISGACMMVRRSAITDVGPLDEAYFLHCEDLDWCIRFRQRGWTILFVPGAKVAMKRA